MFLFYIVQVTRCEEIVEDGNAQLYPNGLDNMTLLEQHPELAMLPAGFLVGANNDQLQGPWRNIRFCKNDGEPQAFLNVLNPLWNTVRPPHAPANYLIGGILLNKLPRVATEFWNVFGDALHQSWNQAVNFLRQNPGGNLRPQCKTRGTLINIAIRRHMITINNINNGNFPVISQWMLDYFGRNPWNPNYQPPARPFTLIRANPSSSLVWTREHELRRPRRRARRHVYYDGMQHDITQLTRTQCALLDQWGGNPPNNMVVGQGWLWAATQP